MSTRTTEHATFVIERSFPADPSRVFAAWASAEAKAKWFGPDLDGGPDLELDFQVGGRERFAATTPDGTTYTYIALYKDIVADERIVYTYEMYIDDERMSVSVATIEFAPSDQGTALTMTEQGVFLDGQDTVAAREHGTREIIEKLAATVSA
ncbi:MAG TPA: SRPBCC domain-containing protein [Solirubrobacteraceae bacterium]|jgi:uncharacterized protein YndB with AHSA1/START domain|nr:SRPBCC domain-containing protein [Solirubrobacteraceae bacterium]